MLSVQALQHVVVAVVAPLLLCLGAPLTLAARATTESSQYGDLGARLRKGGPAFLAVLPAAYMVAFPLLYRTGWLVWSLAGHAAHLFTMALFLGGGLLVFRVLAGVDPMPGPVSRPLRAGLLGGVLLVQLAVGAFLLLGPPVAADWFYLVGPDDAPDLFADQRLAGPSTCSSRCSRSPSWPYGWRGTPRDPRRRVRRAARPPCVPPSAVRTTPR